MLNPNKRFKTFEINKIFEKNTRTFLWLMSMSPEWKLKNEIENVYRSDFFRLLNYKNRDIVLDDGDLKWEYMHVAGF